MPTYDITVEATSDWSTVDIQGQPCWMKAQNEGISFIGNGACLGGFTVTDKRVSFNKRQYDTTPIMVTLQVVSDSPVLELLIGHGDNGYARVSSRFDSVLNHQIVDGQNRVSFRLALTQEAKRQLDDQYESRTKERRLMAVA
jgi:hypothetical protein